LRELGAVGGLQANASVKAAVYENLGATAHPQGGGQKERRGRKPKPWGTGTGSAKLINTGWVP